MNWLATGRTAIATLLGNAALLAAGTVPIERAAAAQDVGQSQLSYTCRFDNGPRTGQSLTYGGVSGPPIPVGVPCSDGQGSTGSVVPQRSVQVPAPTAPPPAPRQRQDMTFICRFDDGPRAGETQSYAGVTGIQSFPVGAPCTDGQGSTGVAIAEPPPPTPMQPPVPVQPIAPEMSFTCHFDTGPRAGQTQSYKGVTGIQPMQVGDQCTDGQGSSGIAVSDVPVPPSAQIASPAPEPVTSPPVMSPAPEPTSPPPAPADTQLPPAPEPLPLPPLPPPRPTARASMPSRTDTVPGAAVGAPVRGLSGAKWADPKNSGSVTGYTYGGRYHSGAPRGYDPITGTILSQSAVPARAIVRAPEVPGDAIVGRSVPGERGAVWADINNDGVADGYVEDGRYFPGVPPGFASGGVSMPPPPSPAAFVPPPVTRSGERG